MCFKSIGDARSFRDKIDYSLPIFKCRAEGIHSTYKLFQTLYTSYNIKAMVLEYLKQKKNKKRIINEYANDAPYGTVFCKKIMLLERVH